MVTPPLPSSLPASGGTTAQRVRDGEKTAEGEGREKKGSQAIKKIVAMLGGGRVGNVTAPRPPAAVITNELAFLFSATRVPPSRPLPNLPQNRPKTVSCSVPGYVPGTSRRPKPNSRRSQDRVVLCSRLRPENVTSAQAEQVAGPKTVSSSVSVNVPRTSRRPKPTVAGSQDRPVLCSVYDPRTSRRPKRNSRRSQDGVVPCIRLRPKHVTSAQAEQPPVPRPCLALFPSTPRERHVSPIRAVGGPKTVSCSVPVYVPRTSRRPKPNSHRSQDRAVLCSRLRPEHVASAQAEQSPVPRPCRALFPSTSRERHVGPSRTVAGPKTMPCPVSIYVPEDITSAQAEKSPVPRPCCALFPSTSRERHVRPKPNSRRSPRPCRALFPATSRARRVGPSRTVTGPKTVPCSVSVYVPRTSRRPKPNSRRSQDHAVPCFHLRPENVTSAQAEQSSVPRPCRALFPSTSRERHVGPSRTVTGPKTVPCSVSVYVPRTSTSAQAELSPAPRPCRALFRLRPENVTSAQAEQSPVPRPCSALFRLRPENVPPAQPNLSRSKSQAFSVSVFIPRASRRPRRTGAVHARTSRRPQPSKPDSCSMHSPRGPNR